MKSSIKGNLLILISNLNVLKQTVPYNTIQQLFVKIYTVYKFMFYNGKIN